MVFRRVRVTLLSCLALGLGLAAAPVLSSAARAASPTVSIGIDHTPPSGHDFLYVDFFPRVGVKIHSGDVIDFGWAASPDGFHTATLLRTGETPPEAWAAHPLAVADGDDGSAQQQFNPTIAAPTNPPPGSGAPGACGDATTPCVYDGSAELNSGANGTDGASHFFVQVNVPAGTTVTFVCLVHPGMAASLDVVDNATPATTPAQASAAASAQAATETSEALAAESAASTAQTTTNSDGTHTVTLTAGTATSHVEVVEMLPKTATITAGDTVRWVTKTVKDIHTVTFPQGSQPATEPLPSLCEGTPDTVDNGPPTACGNPANFEVHFNAAPVGMTVVATPTTQASSGIIGNPPAPFPSRYSFSFPNAGTFTYQCRIHDHMVGTLTVLARAAAPVRTNPRLTG